MATSSEATTSYARTRRRYWQRRTEPVGWWPLGILLPLALLLLWLWGLIGVAPAIERDIEASVTANLVAATQDASWLGSARVDSVTGQSVAVSAVAEETARRAIHGIAQSSRCATWAGDLICPGEVAVSLTRPVPAPAPEPEPAATPEPAAPEPVAQDPVEAAPVAVPTPEAVDACNAQFEDAFAGTTIRFRTSSADIDTSSQSLLAQLAGIARDCPGTLVIEGHTDSRGAAANNQTLSEARAGAVRTALIELGVDGARLQTIGFGESSPIATNDTAAGRARNRRIAIRVVDEPAEERT